MKKQSNNSESYKGLENTGIPEYRNTGGPDTGKSAIHNPASPKGYAVTSPQSAIKKTGFSMMELMMSLGILVVGLAMVATAFPSALLETKHSVADTSATMISENAAAVCRAKLRHSTIEVTVGATLSDQTTLINDDAHTGDLTYPVAHGAPGTYPKEWVEIPSGSGNWFPSTRYGWLLAVRNIRPTGWVAGNPIPNDYQLVFVPYRKFLPDDAAPVFSGVVTDGDKITFGNVSIGAPVICKADGTYAYVTKSDGTLSRTIPSGDALTVIDPDGKDTPAIGCYVVRTAVAP